MTYSNSITLTNTAQAAHAFMANLPRPRACVTLCSCCAERPALVALADELTGEPIEGGLCRECIPAQQPEDAGLAAEYAYRSIWSRPASLELVEAIAAGAEAPAAEAPAGTETSATVSDSESRQMDYLDLMVLHEDIKRMRAQVRGFLRDLENPDMAEHTESLNFCLQAYVRDLANLEALAGDQLAP